MYTPTVADLLAPFEHYPKAIQQAVLLVDTNPRFLGLTRAMKAVTKQLLTRANSRDGTREIRCRVDRVATEAAVSEKTVQRTLRRLEGAGWIQQTNDRRTRWGAFTSYRYEFTAAFCRMVRLPAGKKTAEVETELSDAVEIDLSFKKEYREIQEEKRKANPTPPPVSLPPELQEITTLGVKDTGVAKLRGLAHESGHRLQDIFVVAREHLQAAKANSGRVYRYLAAMINKPSDYAARAAKITRHAAIVAEVTQHKDRTAKYAHKRYAAGPGMVVRIFDGIAEVTRDGQWVQNIAGAAMQQVYDHIEAGKLIEIHN